MIHEDCEPSGKTAENSSAKSSKSKRAVLYRPFTQMRIFLKRIHLKF
ncbi:hypothetical protein RVIR1_03500 [Candidatus Rickettsiella viridis]|uniref:Uncharacterized protein n=1 Tax=Candidatus Rickettsiella viridis TaxID=676208 RepID=A0A2Z5UTP2_9COXI|nr:hypothetical protein RVIR1_03500 [Candidatus Rickettsiella viridis]